MHSLPTRETDRQAARAALPAVKAARAAHPERYPADFDWAIDALEDAWAEIAHLSDADRAAAQLAAEAARERDARAALSLHVTALERRVRDLEADLAAARGLVAGSKPGPAARLDPR